MILDGKIKANIDKAVELIKSGEVVAFPTETVYGLGADAFNEEAVKKIFAIKGRPLNDPLILHISNDEQLSLIAQDLPPRGFQLIQKFWPGPLTLILKKTSKVSDLITAGLETVAVRMPRNIIALALINNSQTVIAAPSANRFQSLSPTTAKDVEIELGEKVSVILDGGASIVGLESTIVDLSGPNAKILRLGGISKEEIEEALDEKIEVVKKALHISAPGMMDFHYAPKTSTIFVREEEFREKLRNYDLENSAVVCFSGSSKHELEKLGVRNIYTFSESGDFSEAARNYFSVMRTVDEKGYRNIICLAAPDEDLGRAINDRLQKAEHK